MSLFYTFAKAKRKNEIKIVAVFLVTAANNN
jgi:hypothetical protein